MSEPMEFAPSRFVVAIAGVMRSDFNVFTEEALRKAAADNPAEYTYEEDTKALIWHPVDRPPPRYVLTEPPSDPIAWLNKHVFGPYLEAIPDADGKLHIREKPEP